MPEPTKIEKKASNAGLHKAKTGKNDEFYTQLSYIEKELGHYKDHFRDKVVFCNCDDPEESHFWRYFSENFEHLGIKKLVSTHYETEKPSYKLEISRDIDGDGKINKKDQERIQLKQNGDFRSPECIEILKSCDIVVTNPPFSLFREYVAQLFEYKKKFLIIGNYNAVTYKEIFPLIKENRMWIGASLDGRNVWFRIPDHYEKYHKIENGVKYAFVASTVWFTNLDYKKRHEDLILYKIYKEADYPKYDNYDAINTDKTKDIPMDYPGLMGVPITFLNKYNPEQFEILGTSDNGLVENEFKTTPGLAGKFVDDYYKAGGTGTYREGNPTAGYYNDGIAKMAYKRLFIKNKKL